MDGNELCTGRSTLMQSPVAVAALKWITDVQLRREADGQDLLEYALLCGLIALIAIGAVSSVGQTIHNVFWQTIAQSF
jgi:Flp pilus assembly pilin Flp